MAKIKICLDAGHYGKYNQSPALKTYYEAKAMWELHLKLKAELEKYGIEVITTRADQSKDYGLKARGQLSKGCNLFLSLHSNATGSAIDNAVDYPLAIVPLDGSGNVLGTKLANCVKDVMKTEQDGRIWTRESSSGKNWYGVINGAHSVGVTGIILEHSFHTNTRIANWLSKDENLLALAKAEAKVIANHYGIKDYVNESVTVKQYKLLTKVSTYATASDAKARKNPMGSYAAGTYYIFTKYPDGVNGMLNITKDTTGVSAGGWINPADNVAVVAPAVKAVYDLDFPKKHLIITDVSKELNKTACTKAIVAIKKNNADFNTDIAKAFFTLAPKYSIDPMRAISQSILETGWFKFSGSVVRPDQNNFCGLGATNDGAAGARFNSFEDGIIAQLQHLYAYGCKNALPATEAILDPRFNLVTRGIAPYWEQLAGRWAVPGFDGSNAQASLEAGTTYGQKIDNIYGRISATAITDVDINTYFPEPVNDDVMENPVEKVPEPEDVVINDKKEPVQQPADDIIITRPEPEVTIEPDNALPKTETAPATTSNKSIAVGNIVKVVTEMLKALFKVFGR